MFWRGARPGYVAEADPEVTIEEDTIEELRRWHAFQEKPAEQYTPPLPKPHFTAAPEPPRPEPMPILSRGPRIGRNDPCTCGSGKKYKKCCGGSKDRSTN